VVAFVVLLQPDSGLILMSYKNGVLEIIFKKKEQAKQKGKTIKVE
jgi:HSP20 family molecular chaperone IbpA